MTSKRQLQNNLRTISWTIGAIFLCLGLLFSAIFLYARREQEQLADSQVAHLSTMIELQAAVGYGGLIHNFKNWVLRPGETVYRDRAYASADQSMALLDQLQTMSDEAQLGVSFDAQRATVAAYRDKIAAVTRMHDENRPVEQIDRAVRIDDSPALGELAALRSEIVAQLRAQQKALVDRRNLVLMAPAGAIVLFLCGLILLMRQRTRIQRDWDAKRLEEMERFTQVAAHDLRAPLRQIAVMAEFAREDLEDAGTPAEPELIEHLTGIGDRARRLEALIAAVFRYILIDGAAEEVTEVDLRQIVLDIARLHVPEGGSLRLDGDFPTARVQRVELEIILRNLISNAVKHHPKGRPNIVVRHAIDGRTHRFEVEDDGPGIAPEHAERVFDVFWAKSQTPESTEVSGLGLALVRRIVTRWGTQLSLRPAQPNGVVFTFSMPQL